MSNFAATGLVIMLGLRSRHFANTNRYAVLWILFVSLTSIAVELFVKDTGFLYHQNEVGGGGMSAFRFSNTPDILDAVFGALAGIIVFSTSLFLTKNNRK
jgi:hypothetical protein